MTHNKNLIPLSYLLINCIFARSAPQILSLKNECTLCFSDCPIIGLCDSSAYCWVDIISLLIAPPKVLTKDLYVCVADIFSKYL